MIAANPALDHDTQADHAAPQPAEPPQAHFDDNALLAAFLDPANATFDLCAQFGLSIADLHAWLASPAIAGALQQYLDIQHLRARIFAAQQAPAAISTIAAIAAGQPPENVGAETARKSAAHILRLAAPPREPRQPRQPRRAQDAPPTPDPAPDAAPDIIPDAAQQPAPRAHARPEPPRPDAPAQTNGSRHHTQASAPHPPHAPAHSAPKRPA